MPGDGFVTAGQWTIARRLTLGRRSRRDRVPRRGVTDRDAHVADHLSRDRAGTRADWPRSVNRALDHDEDFGPTKPANLVVIADHFTERAGGRPHTDVRLANLFDPCLVKPRLTGAVGRDVENPVTDLGPDSAPVSHGCFSHPLVHPGALTGSRPGQRPDPLRRRAREPVGLVADVNGDLRQGGRVLPAVMRAEQQLQAVGEQSPDVSLGAAAVTAIHGGNRPGKVPVRHLALLLPVSASGPEFASTQDGHLLRSPGSAFLKSTPGDRKWESDGPCGAIVGRYGGRRLRGSSQSRV